MKRPLPSRTESIESLQSESFDVVVIGGGATGAGCALDAVTRGNFRSYIHIILNKDSNILSILSRFTFNILMSLLVKFLVKT